MDAIDDLHEQIDEIETLGVEGPDAALAAGRLEALVQGVEALLESDAESPVDHEHQRSLEPRQLDLPGDPRA